MTEELATTTTTDQPTLSLLEENSPTNDLNTVIVDGTNDKPSKENFQGLIKSVGNSIKIELVDGTAVVDVINKNGWKYSRKIIESMRFVNIKGQNKFWKQVYNCLPQTIKLEYDKLHVTSTSKTRSRTRTRALLGESTSENASCNAKTVGSLDFTCDDHNNGKDSVGEWSEEEECDDEYDSIRRPAFWVEGEPDFESGDPEDGLEYLRRVRWEAAQIPQVKVAKIDSSKISKEQSVYMPEIPDIERCPPHLVPLEQWEEEFIANFSDLRLALSHLDNTDESESESQSIIFHAKEQASRSSESLATLKLPSVSPTLSAVLDMDPVTRVTMLKRCINLFDSANSVSKDDCAWIFSLCAAVGTPLDADTSASLRCLLRRCAKLRATKSELDDEVIMLNVLATISGKFFGQLES